MTIRTKLTLWYAVVLFASLMLCGGLLYKEWVMEPREDAVHNKEGVPRDSIGGGMRDLVENLLWSALPAAIFGLGGGWLLTRKALAPVSELTEAIRRINESNLSIRLSRSRNGDELDRLTEVFNEMIERLETSFQRIREFTLRASHELKTPLTIMRGGFEGTLGKEEWTQEMREQLKDEIDEIDRLTKIVDGLTLLTKADASLVKLGSEPVRFDRLVEEMEQDGQILAEPRNISLSLVACEACIILGDHNRLRQLLLNLVDNAVKYNREGGVISLELKVIEEVASLTISNTSKPLSAEQMERAFEPFFRGDHAHSRDIDGCGLGLAIARWIVNSHGGSITMTSTTEGSIQVCVMLPIVTDNR
jgi:signal transduction histidine kinase